MLVDDVRPLGLVETRGRTAPMTAARNREVRLIICGRMRCILLCEFALMAGGIIVILMWWCLRCR